MDAKDLRTVSALSDRNNDGSKYAQSGGIAVQCDRNKSYQDIGSNSLAKVEVQNARPCAVIGPDRVVPPPGAGDAYLKKAPAEAWPCMDYTYRRPPEYSHKLSNYTSPIRNISPRQTFQENMPRIMVQPSYHSAKMNDDTKYAQISDRNIDMSKNIKLNVPPEAKYNCDVPYSVNPNNIEQKNVRNAEMCVSSANPPLTRTTTHGWPPGGVNLRTARSFPAPELYQYQEYPSCAGPRPIVSRPHRTFAEEPGYVYPDSYYPDANIRFKPYPNVKDRYPPSRYDYIGSYNNPFHPPPSFPPHKSVPPHPYSPYAPVKYLENRVADPMLDGYPRNQQGNFNMPYHNQVIHPNYGTVIANCSQNKMHPFPPDGSMKTVAPNKMPYDSNSKPFIEYDNSRPKMYHPSDSYFVNEMGRLHPMKSQVLMPNYPNINMHSGQPNPFYKKDNAQIKNYEYMSYYRNLDPTLNMNNPTMRHLPMFSPNALPISPTDSSASNDTNLTLGTSQEDCGYVSQSSTASVRSMESAINRVHNDYIKRYYDSRYGHLVRSSPMMTKPELHSNHNSSKDKKNIDVRQFLQMWNEGDEETDDSNPKEIVIKTGSSDNNKSTKTHEVPNNHEQLYVLGLVNVSSDELSKYEHIQKVSKLPENIKGYNSIELLDQFEEAIQSSKMANFKSQIPTKGLPSKHLTEMLPRPVSPLDVEAKISQSVIHKEVGCNFEIKPCSPKMLNVEVAAPVQNILGERAIEKVANPVNITSPMLNGMEDNIDCKLMKRQDHRMNRNDNLRIASCKMINAQFSNINSIEPMKSTYSLQDLESNSGLGLASLPRLDNDIELNFPEVNQQFINANKGESAVLSPSFKDLPTLEALDQSDNEIKHKKDDTKAQRPENKIYHSPLSADTEKEVSKLSKYRKNKTGCSEDERKSRVHKEDHMQNSVNAVRTDSVIIKNPDNIKKYDDSSVFSPNMFNDLQDVPMNLTSHVNFELNKKEAFANDYEQPFDIAIDFSLNKNHLFSDVKSLDKEIVETKENFEQEIIETDNLINDPVPANKISFSNELNERDTGDFTHDVIANNNGSIKTSLQNTDVDIHQANENSLKHSNTNPIRSDVVVKSDTVENMIKTTTFECEVKSGTPSSGLLPVLPGNNDCSSKLGCSETIPKNSGETYEAMKQNVDHRDIEKELENIFNDGPQSKPEENIIANNNILRRMADVICENNSSKHKIKEDVKKISKSDSLNRRKRRRRRDARVEDFNCINDIPNRNIEVENVCNNSRAVSKSEEEIIFEKNNSDIIKEEICDNGQLESNSGENIKCSSYMKDRQNKETKIRNPETKVGVEILCNNNQSEKVIENEILGDNVRSDTNIIKDKLCKTESLETKIDEEVLSNSHIPENKIDDEILCNNDKSGINIHEKAPCNSYNPETKMDEGMSLNNDNYETKIDEEMLSNTNQPGTNIDEEFILNQNSLELKVNDKVLFENDTYRSLETKENDKVSLGNSNSETKTDDEKLGNIDRLKTPNDEKIVPNNDSSETHTNEVILTNNNKSVINPEEEIMHNIDNLDNNIDVEMLCHNDSEIKENICSNDNLKKEIKGEMAVCNKNVDENQSNEGLLGNNDRPETNIVEEIIRDSDMISGKMISNVLLDNSDPDIETKEVVCGKNIPESKFIDRQFDILLNTDVAQADSDNHSFDSVLAESPKSCSEVNLIFEDALTDTIENKGPIEFATEKFEQMASKDIISNEVIVLPTYDTKDMPKSIPSLVEAEDLKLLENKNIDSGIQDTNNKATGSALISNKDRCCEKGTSNLIVWTKAKYSPWIQKLVTFCTGNINTKGNTDLVTNNDSVMAIVEKNDNDSPADQVFNEPDVIKEPEEINNKDENGVPNDKITKNMHSLDVSPNDNKSRIESQSMTDEEIHPLTDEQNIEKNNKEYTIDTLNLNAGSLFEMNTKEIAEIEIKDDVSNDEVIENHMMSPNTETLTNETDTFTNTVLIETNDIYNDIESRLEKLGEVGSFNTEETCTTSQKVVQSVGFLPGGGHIIEEEMILEEQRIEFNKPRCDSFDTSFKRRKQLKRSLSDSVLNTYNNKEKQDREYEHDIQLLWPLKRKKGNNIEESVEPNILAQNLASIIQHNRRKSVSAFYNEDDVSFCILIDDSCIITEEDNEEQKICYTEEDECLELQTGDVNEENEEIVGPITSSPQLNIPCEYSDSYTLNCDEDKILENSWVDDIACVETVISDDIAEDIVISGPSSIKDIDCSDNDESGVFSSAEHTDKVKCIYGDKMCSDDALYLETLYNTPQMDVTKTLCSREPHVIEESEKYYDKDSLEKILSESNGKESYTPEFMDSIMPLSVPNYNNTPDDKENINMEILSSPLSNLNSDLVTDIKLNADEEEGLQLNKTQDDTVHSCESSIDNVFSYKNDSNENNTNIVTSSSPEVSSTTSEEKNSSILLKITSYKGSRIAQVNGISSVNNRPSCKFTEEKDYLQSHSNYSKNRPLLTKAAQKYIPPLKESIRDLKVKLPLPQHSLLKLKQLKKSKDEPKSNQLTNNMARTPKKPKPKFEDVLMSIDEMQFKKHKEKTKKQKQSIPKVVIKKSVNGSHYASTSKQDNFNPDLTGRKWQPWVFLEKNSFIDKMAIRKKLKAIYSHRQKSYVLAEKFKKYKSINHANFVISQPKTDKSSTGLKYTIRLKHHY